MKKIINDPENIVLQMCQGMVLAHSEIELIDKYKVLKKVNIDSNKVTLISGGGSGHEPAHGGFIGEGLLDVAVCGDVFASPSQIQVYQALISSKSQKGTLLIIKNYSGDMMNFTNAMHLAKEDGLEVDYVKIDDDIAVQDSLYTVGNRGVAGTIFVHKIAGAAAQMGKSLSETKALAQMVIDNVRSLGFALNSCTVPAKGSPTFVLGPDEMEYGVGIHGEPGIRREKVLTADELAKRMVISLVDNLKLAKGQEVAILVNGFGSTPLMELYLFNYAIRCELDELGIVCYRDFVGNYMTSIDMQGASLSILKLNDALKPLLDAKAESPALCLNGKSTTIIDFKKLTLAKVSQPTKVSSLPANYSQIKNNRLSFENLQFIVHKMAEIIIANEVYFCELDSVAGDGDFGMSIAKGFRVLQNNWTELVNDNKTPASFLAACSLLIMEHCGGASGPIWGSAFRGASKAIVKKDEKDEKDNSLSLAELSSMAAAMVKAIQITGERSFGRGAVVGDKTLIDALEPFAISLSSSLGHNLDMLSAFNQAAMAAVEGAKSTCNIVARMGRAGTVGERSLGHPDAGAYALGLIFTQIAASLTSS